MNPNVIWKFPLDFSLACSHTGQMVSVPGGIVWYPLDAQIQDGQVVLWASVDPYLDVELVNVSIVGTGGTPPANHWHVATVQAGPLVWHIFADRITR